MDHQALRYATVTGGFGSEDAWFEYPLENDPRFLSRIEKAGLSVKQGRGKVWRTSSEV